MERHDIDSLLGEIRKKVVRGSKHTRHGRLKGALRTVPIKHPTKPRDYGRATLGEELNTMSLHDAIQRFRSVSEAALPAPAPQGQVASGKQDASKSKFTGTEPKNQQDYKRDPVKEPSDPESMAAATKSTAGVKGPGYDSTGRERVDVRFESVLPVAEALVNADPTLGLFLGALYEASSNEKEFAAVVEKHVGADRLKTEIAKFNGSTADPIKVAEAIGFAKFGKDKFNPKKMKESEHGADVFHTTPKKDKEDLEFAEAMLRDKVGDLSRRAVIEANTPAPAPDQKTPDGAAQTASKSRFDEPKGKHEKYTREPATVPADAEAKAAAVRSTAGVSGPGYDASGREQVDIRFEQAGNRKEGPRAGEDPDHAFVRMNGLG